MLPTAICTTRCPWACPDIQEKYVRRRVCFGLLFALTFCLIRLPDYRENTSAGRVRIRSRTDIGNTFCPWAWCPPAESQSLFGLLLAILVPLRLREYPSNGCPPAQSPNLDSDYYLQYVLPLSWNKISVGKVTIMVWTAICNTFCPSGCTNPRNGCPSAGAESESRFRLIFAKLSAPGAARLFTTMCLPEDSESWLGLLSTILSCPSGCPNICKVGVHRQSPNLDSECSLQCCLPLGLPDYLEQCVLQQSPNHRLDCYLQYFCP